MTRDRMGTAGVTKVTVSNRTRVMAGALSTSLRAALVEHSYANFQRVDLL